MILEGLTVIAVVGGVLAALGMTLLWYLLRRDEQRARRTQVLLDPMGDVSQLP
jgi:hypothetical protein